MVWRPPAGTTTLVEPVDAEPGRAALTAVVVADDRLLLDLGASPGPEFLMSLAVEHEDAFELVDLFCGEIIDALRQPNAAAH